MEPDVGNLPFAVELKLQLSGMSFGQHGISETSDSPPDFSKLDTLDAPRFFGRCFFGRNNLGEYPDDNFGVNCQYRGHKEVRISDGISGEVYNNDGKYSNNDRAEYSFAWFYAQDEIAAQIRIYLMPDIFERIYMAKNSVNFHLVTSLNEHKKITEEQSNGKDNNPDSIIVEGRPGRISLTDKFTLDIGKEDFGQWYFRVRLVSLGFPSDESPQASKN